METRSSDTLKKAQSEQPAEIMYIFVEDKLRDLAKLYKAFQEIEEITDVGPEVIMRTINNNNGNPDSRALCLLDDVVNNIGLEGYVFNFLPGESRKIGNLHPDKLFTYHEESGLFSISESNLSKYLDEDDIGFMVGEGFLEEDDPDGELIQLVIDAFSNVGLYPDDYWEQESQVIRGLPEELKCEIRDCVVHQVDGDKINLQHRSIRRIILEHLKVI